MDEIEQPSKSATPAQLAVKMTNEGAIRTTKCIAFNECLKKLLQFAVGTKCKECGTDLAFRDVMKGTCLVLMWECALNGKHHKGSWASQPRLHNMYAGNLITPTCLLLSGNSYAKVALMAKFLNLGFTSASSFYR